MIFFASFFPYYAVNDAQYSASAKTATCILAPACFALGANVFADYEGGLVGIQTDNYTEESSNFSYSACVGMLFLDAVLYGLLVRGTHVFLIFQEHPAIFSLLYSVILTGVVHRQGYSFGVRDPAALLLSFSSIVLVRNQRE